MALPNLVALSGSLRRESYNTIILETLAARFEGIARIRLHRYHDLPLYNEDDDVDPALAPVSALRKVIGQADGLIIATPEFNHGMPGVLKNALDWASRPRGLTVLKHKPVLTITSSPGKTGGVRAHAQLHVTLLSVAARIVLRPQAVICMVHEKVHDRRLVDGEALQFLDAAVQDLIAMASSEARG